MRIHAVRHAEPSFASAICYGQTDFKIPKHINEAVASDLIRTMPKGCPIFTSPLLRCSELADVLSFKLGAATARRDARLMEMNFGTWEMQAWDDISRVQIDEWSENIVHYRPGGGETALEFTQRVCCFLNDVVKTGFEQVIVVCHAGTIKQFLAYRHDLGMVQIAMEASQVRDQIAFGSALILDLVVNVDGQAQRSDAIQPKC